MYKIYFDDRILVLTDKDNEENQNNFDLFYRYEKKKEFKVVFQVFRKTNEIKSFCVYHPSVKKIWELVKRQFKIVEAAGGVVQNEKGEQLFIFRREKWDLPKGKMEKGETIEEAAIREVKEECGFKHLKIEAQLPTTYHTYQLNNKWILKPTYWFLMQSDETDLTPQTEEEITELRWVTPNELDTVLSNTFSSIRELLAR